MKVTGNRSRFSIPSIWDINQSIDNDPRVDAQQDTAVVCHFSQSGQGKVAGDDLDCSPNAPREPLPPSSAVVVIYN